MTVRCLLWDFGDTLFDELSLWRGSPQWLEVYRSFDETDGPGAAWSLGQIDDDEFAGRVAERSGMTREEIRNHLARTDLFVPFPYTLEFFRQRHRPQAIVTVNPSTFRLLASRLGLAELTDTMVISGEEGSIDKALLCERALERMALDCSPAEALLIDNIPSNVAAWVARGGIGYVHRGDEAFRSDAAGGVEALTASGVRAEAADWDLLTSLGLPLTSAEGSHPRAQIRDLPAHVIQAALELSEEEQGEARERKVESLQALLLALSQHFPSTYRQWFGRVPIVQRLVPREPSGRVIKLARVARARLAESL